MMHVIIVKKVTRLISKSRINMFVKKMITSQSVIWVLYFFYRTLVQAQVQIPKIHTNIEIDGMGNLYVPFQGHRIYEKLSKERYWLESLKGNPRGTENGLVFDFDDDACLAINFWWFGYCHYAVNLANHKMTARLGPNALDLTLDQFRELLRGRRGGIKSFLLNQSHIAGIGNVYVQDPLFKARIHPLRRINTLGEDEIETLWEALRETLQESVDHDGSAWEMDLYGQKGRWDSSFFLVAYREGQPCPECGTTIEKIKTGSTSGFVCLQCQSLNH